MTEKPLAQQPYPYQDDDEIDLIALFLTLKRYIWLILGLFLIATMATYFYAQTLPSVYKAKSVIFSPSKSSSSGGGYMAALNSMGMGSLIAGAESTPVDIIVKLLSSRRMAKDLIQQYDLSHYYQGSISPRILSVLTGLSDQSSQDLFSELQKEGYLTPEGFITVKFNPNHPGFKLSVSDTYLPYLPKIVDVLGLARKTPKKAPSPQQTVTSTESTRFLMEKTIQSLQASLTVEKDKSTFVTVGFEDRSPLMAALIVNSCVSNLDRINEQLEITSQKPLVIVLDKAENPSTKSKPNKKTILLIGALSGLIASVFLAFSIDFFRNLSKRK